MATLTLRDVDKAGGVTDELLAPYVKDSSEAEAEAFATGVRQFVRYCDGLDMPVRVGKLDEPIITVPEPKKEKKATAAKKPAASSSRSANRSSARRRK